MKIQYLMLALLSAGCSPGNAPEMLAQTNLMIIEGDTAQELQAPDNGQITVYDNTARQMLFTTRISSGQSFKVDPVARQATINGRPVNGKELPGDHELKVTFTRTK